MARPVTVRSGIQAEPSDSLIGRRNIAKAPKLCLIAADLLMFVMAMALALFFKRWLPAQGCA